MKNYKQMPSSIYLNVFADLIPTVHPGIDNNGTLFSITSDTSQVGCISTRYGIMTKMNSTFSLRPFTVLSFPVSTEQGSLTINYRVFIFVFFTGPS
mmetsp:Transcript_21752/g.32228  ORF Transcript_21752/g.32228 Transcript_21752/m.32228 type:complete len:96 (-) Transcript_21752:862-1149(-)